jgi:hypothetical protein
MPSLLSTDVTANYLKNVRANGLGPRTVIVQVAGTNLTDANLNTISAYLTTSHGSNGTGDSAFVIAGFAVDGGGAFVSGTTDTVFYALQGTGDLTVADADCSIGGVTVSIVATFDQNYQ